jgi:hypothetical protein
MVVINKQGISTLIIRWRNTQTARARAERGFFFQPRGSFAAQVQDDAEMPCLREERRPPRRLEVAAVLTLPSLWKRMAWVRTSSRPRRKEKSSTTSASAPRAAASASA